MCKLKVGDTYGDQSKTLTGLFILHNVWKGDTYAGHNHCRCSISGRDSCWQLWRYPNDQVPDRAA